MASRTLKVAMVFCSRSFLGCCQPSLMSALAARWKTKSAPFMAEVRAGRSRLSPRTSLNFGCLTAPSRKRSWPVERLSQPVTVTPSARRRSMRLEPMKPAAPVTKTFCIERKSGGERLRPGLQGEADAEVVEEEGQEGQREEAALLQREVRVELGEDLVRQVDVLALDEDVV